MNPISLFLLCVIAVPGCTQQTSPAANRCNEFLAAFNTKDETKVRSMVKASFSPAMFASRKEDAWVKQTLSIANELAPMEIEKKLLEEANRIVAECSTTGGRKMGLMIVVDSAPPNGIVGIQLSPNPEELMRPVKRVNLAGFATLDDLGKKVVAELETPAIGLAEWRDGKVTTAVSGIRKKGNAAPVQVADLWLIGSNTKSMTATLIATFIQGGKLRWDSRLGELLKDIPMKEGYRNATLEQLMQHMAGIPQDMGFTGQAVNKIVKSETDPQKIRVAYAKDILSRDPIAKPGTRFAYSNAGYALLSVIAERIGKKPFGQLMKERVFIPIGMTSAKCGVPGSDGMPGGPNQPSGHFMLESGPRPGVMSGPLTHMCVGAGAGVACSVEDLAKYVAWHMRGYLGESVPGLRSDLVRRLHTPLPRKPGVEMYAAGWVIDDDAMDSPMHEHAGSDGTFIAEMAFWPKRKFAAVAITNVGGEGNPSPALQALRAMYQTRGSKSD